MLADRAGNGEVGEFLLPVLHGALAGCRRYCPRGTPLLDRRGHTLVPRFAHFFSPRRYCCCRSPTVLLDPAFAAVPCGTSSGHVTSLPGTAAAVMYHLQRMPQVVDSWSIRRQLTIAVHHRTHCRDRGPLPSVSLPTGNSNDKPFTNKGPLGRRAIDADRPAHLVYQHHSFNFHDMMSAFVAGATRSKPFLIMSFSCRPSYGDRVAPGHLFEISCVLWISGSGILIFGADRPPRPDL